MSIDLSNIGPLSLLEDFPPFELKQMMETSVTRIDSSGNIESAEDVYLVRFEGDVNEYVASLAVRAFLLNEAKNQQDNNKSSPYNGCALSIEVDETFSLRDYKIIASYEKISSGGSAADPTAEATISFSTGGGTRHVNYAISQASFGSEDVKFDIGNGINWNGEFGNSAAFNGVDVPAASLRETYSKVMSLSAATAISFRRKVALLTGCVNKETFHGWEPGEALFTGCSFSGNKSDGNVVVNFDFQIKPNEKNVQIGGISIGSVKGWQYVWTLRPKVSASGNSINTRLDKVYVADVLQYASFASLGI